VIEISQKQSVFCVKVKSVYGNDHGRRQRGQWGRAPPGFSYMVFIKWREA